LWADREVWQIPQATPPEDEQTQFFRRTIP
jgi:hypothetical protein